MVSGGNFERLVDRFMRDMPEGMDRAEIARALRATTAGAFAVLHDSISAVVEAGKQAAMKYGPRK